MPGQRPGPAAPGEPEQDGLGLVVQRVSEQDRRSAVRVGLPRERRVAGMPGGGLRPAVTAHVDADDPAVVGAEREDAAGDGQRPPRRAVLEAVVDDDPRHLVPGVARLERRSPRRAPASRRRPSRRPRPIRGGCRPAPPGPPADGGDLRRRAHQPRTRSTQRRGVSISSGVGSRSGCGPDLVEALHPLQGDDRAHERRAVAVLRHLRVQAQQPAQQAVEGAGSLAALVEPPADVRHGRDHLGADAVHHHVRVAFEQAHHGGGPGQHRSLLGGHEDLHQAVLAATAGELTRPAHRFADHLGELARDPPPRSPRAWSSSRACARASRARP